MSSFQCVGGACEETCCADFHVDIDQQTFQHYAAVKEPAVLAGMLKTLVRPVETPTPALHARIAMTASGECPFLDAHRLCSIQGALGEAALSETCRAFPRAEWERNGVGYLGGKLSCPEAARLCLASPDAMDMPASGAVPRSAREVIHTATEEMLRDRAIPVWKAILFAGVMAQDLRLDDAGASVTAEDAAGHAAQTRRQIVQTPYALGDQASLQLKLLIETILSASAKCNAARNRFPHVAQTALGAIFDGADDFEGATANYRRLHRQGFEPFERAHDHALRNYVLNYLFTNQVFVSGPAFAQFQNLAMRFGIMRLLLTGLSAQRPDGLTLADCATVVSSASRILDHDASISPQICAALDAVEPRSISLAARMVIPPV
jgi:lysine-N-methylase